MPLHFSHLHGRQSNACVSATTFGVEHSCYITLHKTVGQKEKETAAKILVNEEHRYPRWNTARIEGLTHFAESAWGSFNGWSELYFQHHCNAGPGWTQS